MVEWTSAVCGTTIPARLAAGKYPPPAQKCCETQLSFESSLEVPSTIQCSTTQRSHQEALVLATNLKES